MSLSKEEADALIEQVIAAVDREIDKRLRATSKDTTQLFESIKGYVGRNVKPLAERLTSLEQRKTMSFEGPHDIARSYRCGDCVQRSGGLYVALTANDETPGSSAYWRRIGDAK